MTYIAPRTKVFKHLDRLSGWERGEKPAPVTVEWDLSNRCTLGCQDCHFAHTHVRGPWATKPRMLPMAFEGTGDLADIHTVKRGLKQMAKAGVKGIVWSGGGEPTTHPEWVEAVEFAKFLGLKQGMYTLGGLLTAGKAWTLAACAEWVVVSLDCVSAEDYSAEKGVSASRFQAACEGIAMLSAAKQTTVGVSFLLHAGNWKKAPDMRALALSLGATYVTFRPVIRTQADSPSVCTDDRSWVTEAKPLLEYLSELADVEIDVHRFEEYRDWQTHGYSACHGIKLNAVVTPDGRVWLCPQRRGVANSLIGDLSKESFSDLWARHPGQWTEFSGCRVMCRLHPVNQSLAAVYAPQRHEAFI